MHKNHAGTQTGLRLNPMLLFLCQWWVTATQQTLTSEALPSTHCRWLRFSRASSSARERTPARYLSSRPAPLLAGLNLDQHLWPQHQIKQQGQNFALVSQHYCSNEGLLLSIMFYSPEIRQIQQIIRFLEINYMIVRWTLYQLGICCNPICRIVISDDAIKWH